MGTRNIELGIVPKPTITDPHDAIVRVTHTSIAGSDIHLYEGDLNDTMRKGDILGHEGIGYVEEVGSNVKHIQVGDRVIVLPTVACGACGYCKNQDYSLCDETNMSKDMERTYGQRISGMLGFTHFRGGYPGIQAEYCRVPIADMTCVKAPKDVEATKLLALADVTTSAWHACELAELNAGDIVGVWGCGPLGLSIQQLARLRGARTVYAMDKDPHRLRLAESIGMTPVDVAAHPEVADYILSIQPQGLDRSIEASGFRSTQKPAHAAQRALGLERDSCDTISAMIKSTRKGGNLALIGDFCYTTNDFPIGPLMQKGLMLRGGQVPAQKVRRGCFLVCYSLPLQTVDR